jgi:hypothetical protein
MSDQEKAIVGLKRELKTIRGRVRELKDEAERWRSVAHTLRNLAGIDGGQFKNLLRAQSLTVE